MTKDSRVGALYNLAEMVEVALDKCGTLPPAVDNILTRLENEMNNGNFYQRLKKYLGLNTPSVKENALKRGGNSEMGENTKKQNVDLSDLFLGDARRRLGRFQDQLVTVEFCCCTILKKATGCLRLIGRDFIELTGNPLVEIELISWCGELEDCTQYADRIIILLETVCAIEIICSPCCTEDAAVEEKTEEKTEEK